MSVAWGEAEHLVLDEVDSTNTEARRRAEAGAAHPLWILARRQTAGRGRMGRVWSTPDGNFAATLLLPLRGWSLEALADLGIAATLAVADTLAGLAPGAGIAVKWPNDVLMNGAKVSGILLENFGVGSDGVTRVAIGIGLNLAHHPDPGEVRWRPSSVLAETGVRHDPVDVLANLSPRLAEGTDLIAEGARARLVADWRARLTGIGAPIEVRLPTETLHGDFLGITDSGMLVLGTGSGERRIGAADIFFPGAA